MIKDLSKIYEVYKHIPLGDGGNDIKNPENCETCLYIRNNCIWYHECPVCGHLVEEQVSTDQKLKYGTCWCQELLNKGYIEKREDFIGFVKQCLLECIGDFEIISSNYALGELYE